MQRNWTEKNVDLALLATYIDNFFKEKGFETIREEVSTGCQILAEDSPNFKIQGYVNVTIEGKPQDFDVKLDHCGKKKHSSFSSLLLRMMGGGYLVLQEMKSEEAWTELEKQFWRHVENLVLRLSNSAELST